MAQYIMLLNNPAQQAGPQPTPEQYGAVIEKYRQWSEKMGKAGKLAGGNKLADDAGRILRANGGQVVTTDGPSAKTQEVIGGYFIIEAGGYDEAVELTKSCPHLEFVGSVVLRELDPM